MMISKVKDQIYQYHMLEQGQWVIIGLSGGADSVALLSVLTELQEAYGLHLLAAHVNHGIRGKEAERDMQFCKELCSSLQVELRTLCADVPGMAKQSGDSEETCGRKVRYAFFQKIEEDLCRHGIAKESIKIATAHTAQDQAETFLFHLARGAGLSGLCGIPAVRGNVIRPLLSCTREEIERYLKERDLPHCEDSSNSDLSYTRNRIRHKVLPELETCCPGALSNIFRCILLLEQDEAFLTEQAEKLRQEARIGETDTYDAACLLQAPPAVSSRVLATLMKEICGQDVTEGHIEKAAWLLESGGKMQIPTGAYLQVQENKLWLSKALPQQKDSPDFSFPGAAQVTLPFGTFQYRVLQNPEYGTLPDRTNPAFAYRLDFDKIEQPFTLRNRRPGDRFSPAFRKVSKTLKALFNEAKVPPEERNDRVLLISDGKIAWIEGFGPSEKVRVRPETGQIMEISITRRNHHGK